MGERGAANAGRGPKRTERFDRAEDWAVAADLRPPSRMNRYDNLYINGCQAGLIYLAIDFMLVA